MAILLLLVLLAGFIVMPAMFLWAAWRTPGRAKWLGLMAIVVSAPFFYWLGAFSEQFGAGQCYSNAMGSIASAVEQTGSPRELAQKIRDLPMHGYETVCSEVESAAAALPHASAP